MENNCKHTYAYYNGAKCRHCNTQMDSIIDVEGSDPRVSPDMIVKLKRRETPFTEQSVKAERARLRAAVEKMIDTNDYGVEGNRERDAVNNKLKEILKLLSDEA